ncbi:hypothetical protein PanWU01x14_355070, partial [Parasponia andersonii]
GDPISSSSILIDEASVVDWHSSAPQSTGFAKLRSWRILVQRRVSPHVSAAQMAIEFSTAMLKFGKELVYFSLMIRSGEMGRVVVGQELQLLGVLGALREKERKVWI